MTAYGYVRVSTKDQVDGYGLKVQTRTVGERAVVRAGIENRVMMYADEGVSGTVLNRPALDDMLMALTAGDVVYVPRLDRLARDLIVQELLIAEIRRKGATIVSCEEGENAYLEGDGTDPSRTLIRQILGAIAQYERAMIARRTQAGKRAKKAAGGYAGGQPPYGWTGRNGELVEVPEEQRAITLMRNSHRLVDDFEQIAAGLNAYGHRRRNGKPWTRTAVRKVLLRQGTPAGAVRADVQPVDAPQVDDQVVGADRDGRQNVGADGSGPLGL